MKIKIVGDWLEAVQRLEYCLPLAGQKMIPRAYSVSISGQNSS